MTWHIRLALWAVFAGAIALAGAGVKLYLKSVERNAYAKGQVAGRAEIQEKWDKASAEALRTVRAEEERRQKIITNTVTKYIEKAAEEKVVYRDIIREVPNYVPSDLPMLPGSFRLLHDAAASGSPLPEAGGAGGVDAAAVEIADFAETLIFNYQDCQDDKTRLQTLIGLIHYFQNIEVEKKTSD
jgi:hypothetical protein